MENLALGDNICEYQLYWETNRFYQTEELDSLILDETLSGYYDSSSPDGAQSSAAANSKNIVSERNRRKKLLDRLHALRAVVPKITKMDKASIIKDAINYIQELHEQERQIQAEISQLESMAFASRKSNSLDDSDHQDQYRQTTSFLPNSRLKKKKIEHQHHHHHHGYDDSSGATPSSPIQLIELRVSYVQEKTVIVSLTCTKRRDTIIKLCEVFESLKLNIITASITTFSGTLLKTVFIEADEEEKDLLKIQIETAIAALHDPDSPMSG